MHTCTDAHSMEAVGPCCIGAVVMQSCAASPCDHIVCTVLIITHIVLYTCVTHRNCYY